jgi:hypothetical protein
MLRGAGAAKIAVAVGDGGLGMTGTDALGGAGAAPGADGSVTRNVFWHFPQRMVSPWGPIRASSTR